MISNILFEYNWRIIQSINSSYSNINNLIILESTRARMLSSLSILFLFYLLQVSQAYNPCSVIVFSDYSFDLTKLSSQMIPMINSIQTRYVSVYYCTPIVCPGDPTNQLTFLQRLGGNKCQPYTINATIISNFQYIDSSAPATGIQINYLPYIVTTSSVDANNVTTITQNQYSASIKLYCPTANNQNANCQQSSTAPVITQSSQGQVNSVVQNNLKCVVSTSIACPSLTVNHFWQFLNNNAIWFAVVIWIFAIFQLFMGYFVIRLTILLYGISTGAVFGIILSAQNYTNFFFDDSNNSIPVFIILLSFLMGLLFGIALLTLPKLGYINIGMWDAIIFTLLLQNAALYATGSMLGFYITLGVACLLMTAVSLLGFRKFIIISTPFISAFWIIRTLGFFLPYYPNQFASTKLFTINNKTPWQFYLYLISIIVLAALGCAFQFCWYKKKGRDNRNKGFYLQDDDNIREKMKKFLQFNDIKNLIKSGKDEFMFLKNLVVEEDEEQQPVKDHQKNQKKDKGKYIEMAKMNKLQKQSSPVVTSFRRQQGNESDEEDEGRKIKKPVHSSGQQGKVVRSISKQNEKKPVSSSASEGKVIRNLSKQKDSKISANSIKSKINSKPPPSPPRQPSIAQSEGYSEESEEVEVKKIQVKGRTAKR